jgi:DNA-binding MarR family transcriptional regulator
MTTRRRSSSALTTADVRTAMDAFRRIVQALRAGGQMVESRTGLTPAQAFALQQLAECPGASINDIAERTLTHQSSVSVVVQRLVERRLVVKLAAVGDRRRRRLMLTPAGKERARRSPVPVQERLIAGLTALSRSDRRALARILSTVADAVGPMSRPPSMLFEDHP